MKFDNLFNSRDKTFVRISEAADYLSRLLRENLSIFEIDDAHSKVTFLSEKNNFITCEYGTANGKMTMSEFIVESLESVTDDERIDEAVSKEVSEFVTNLSEDRFDKAEGSFESILEAFTSRHRIKEARSKLDKKIARFNAAYSITDSPEYKKLEEVAPMLKKFLTENKETIAKNHTLMEGMRLSCLVSEAYDLPRMSYDALDKAFIVVPENNKKSLYEMICEKELVRKELLEAKESFSRMWVGNDSIADLASCIYSNDPAIIKNIKECVKQIPYFALSSKSDVYEVLNAVYEVTNPGTISQKDIRDYVAKIFEMKKPHKSAVLNTLNEKYGVNMQNLKFIPSFKGLAEIYSDVMGIVSESAGEGVLHDVCSEFAHFMKKKGGVEVLDVASFLQENFNEADITIISDKEAFGVDALSAEITEQFAGDEEEDMDAKDLEKKPKKKKKEGAKKDAKGDDTEGTEPDVADEEEGEEGEEEENGKKKKGKKPIEEKADKVNGPGDANNVVGGAEPSKRKKGKKLKEEVEPEAEPSMQNDAFGKAEYAPEEDEKAEGEGEIKSLVNDLEEIFGEIDLSKAVIHDEDIIDGEEEETTGQEETPA